MDRLIPHFFHLEGVTLALAILGTFGGIVRWLYHGINAFQSQSRFVQDMATNHLPHIYERLGQIDYHVGIEPKQPPPIKFSGD